MTDTTKRKPQKSRMGLYAGLVAAAVLGAIAIDTTVVTIGSEQDARVQAFNPDRFGEAQFPRIRDLVLEKAPDAVTLSTAIKADKKGAVAEYGTPAGAFAVLPVKATGTVGEGKSGIYQLTVDGLEGVKVRVQTGPAINGTELRDIPGDIVFGDFKNQIEYQDAGAGLNRAMAADTLDGLDRDALPGKTITVTGVFTLISAKNWLITPVALEVQ
ncbi:DUF2291 family protein [Tropicibacter naphthalenivorans]|nr:DUF2291 domain-containing protein [Tropicibacter naphthalenivorans]